MKKLIPLILLALSACSLPLGALPGLPGSQTAQQSPAPLEVQASFTPTPLLPSATATPAFTATAQPSPTPTPHPLSVLGMRQKDYPGSDIVIEQTLDPGANYYRYYASYRSEGLKIYALLTVPYGERPATGWPVVVFNHGYIPPDVYRTTERYIAYTDGFSRNGYIVLRSDYRGHADSEGNAGGAYSRPDYTIDVLNAVASIKRFPEADPNRIGMWGHSMGGHITLRAMVTTRDIKAGVIWAGVVASYPDMAARWRATPPASISTSARGWRASLIQQYGTPEENPEFWASISPITYVGEASGPIQLHHGDQDESVPIYMSESLYQAALTAGLPVEFYAYPGNDHNLSQSFSVAMQRSIEFFDQYVKGEGD